ncbi:MAG: RecQ family ATP-dependent DNA helicase [Pusillimonas sp.]
MDVSEIQDKIEEIAFVDLEVNPKTSHIVDMAAILGDNHYHGTRIESLLERIKKSKYLCGHNILAHDLKYLKERLIEEKSDKIPVIDTLLWSPLLFPQKPYHKLVKNDKLEYDQQNNPFNDCINTKVLLIDELSAFLKLNAKLKAIYFLLLHKNNNFCAFFQFFDVYEYTKLNCEQLIKETFKDLICENSNLGEIIENKPVELAYALAIINVNDRDSITPRWVMVNYPEVENLVFELTNKMCKQRCNYCMDRFDSVKALKRHFHFDQFRKFADRPLQEEAVRAVIENNDSILAVFPTGGGKSVTFQLPALVAGEAAHALTVVISPLQSLMKDQVDNLENKGILVSATINGSMDPIEKRKAFERTEDGQTSIIYLSPESLRSKSIERLLLSRNIARFVIDEAHCFSSWGQDFRVDYLYIGDFIKRLQEKKRGNYKIQVSCFTATAKVQVIEDIKSYFRQKLGLELKTFTASGQRKNLEFKVIEVKNESQKYATLRHLIEEKNCPTIVYTSRTKTTEEIANKLTNDKLYAIAYHGKMESDRKTNNQEDFINGKVDVIVATSAFGMGVDKSNVGLVVHYDIADSLENYIQEAGRAARDENLTGECYILFDKNDLDKHFIMLHRTRINHKEIDQVWKAVKQMTKDHPQVSKSALEISQAAGWNENVQDIETRVKTAISALETAKFLKRGQNNPRVYGNSIIAKSTIEAAEIINNSGRFTKKEAETAIHIISRLFSAFANRHNPDNDGESRVEYLADRVGVNIRELLRLISLLREINLLGDSKDLTAKLTTKIKKKAMGALSTYFQLENFLLKKLGNEKILVEYKKLKEEAENAGIHCQDIRRLKKLINFWEMRGWIKKRILDINGDKAELRVTSTTESIKTKITKRQKLAEHILKTLLSNKNEELRFSELELKLKFEAENALLKETTTCDGVEEALFFLSRIGAITIDGGFMVIYNRLFIERLEKNPYIQFKKDDYETLERYYNNKTTQIHIVGEYAELQSKDKQKALEFVEDYFTLPFNKFIMKYFPGELRKKLEQNITPEKFHDLFGMLSERQLSIIREKEAKQIIVAAGPGSGKTRVLVHKLASLILLEEVKHEQLLMLTFSRAAVTEFKKRLFALIGNAAFFVEIKTFHSYCFDLLGKPGSLKDSDNVVANAVKAIKDNKVEKNRITKSVLVIDEAQDMDANEFKLIETLIDNNENLQLIAVGDDDQNIYEFRGSSSANLKRLLEKEDSKKIELNENFRSNEHLVKIANDFSLNMSDRLKKEPLIAKNPKTGFIDLTFSKSNSLFELCLNKIKKNHNSGTCAVLTYSNIDALIMDSLLKQHDIPSRIVQENRSFSLENLLEIRFFINFIEQESENKFTVSDEIWKNALTLTKLTFSNSGLLEVVEKIITDFYKTSTQTNFRSDFKEFNPEPQEVEDNYQTSNQRIYLSDFKEFLRESKLENFYSADSSEILVSTIHKSKGKEFDNVFMMLDNKDFPMTQEKLRGLYVALTRAKTGLTVITNDDRIRNLIGEKTNWHTDEKIYPDYDKIILNIGHEDVHLDYFMSIQKNIDAIVAGSQLTPTSNGCNNQNGAPCLRYSRKFSEKLEEYSKKGYKVESAEAEYVLWWQKQAENDTDTTPPEIKIILPKLCLKKARPAG